MSQTNRTDRRRHALSGAQAATPVIAADSAAAKQNLALFDRVDFESWNNRDWDLFSQLHGNDVYVEGFG